MARRSGAAPRPGADRDRRRPLGTSRFPRTRLVLAAVCVVGFTTTLVLRALGHRSQGLPTPLCAALLATSLAQVLQLSGQVRQDAGERSP